MPGEHNAKVVPTQGAVSPGSHEAWPHGARSKHAEQLGGALPAARR